MDWQGCQIHFGLILSGSTLANSKSFVESLISIEPEAVGGEMEASGIYNVAAKRKLDWIIVKGICDWGYNKTIDYQEIAVRNAVQFVTHVISQGGLAD